MFIFKFQGLLWHILTFTVGIWLLVWGLRVKKAKEKRQAGILLIIMGICAFVHSVLEVAISILHVFPSTMDVISKIQLIVGGIWLGIFIVMSIFGHFRILKGKE
jgi:hypothetical protein